MELKDVANLLPDNKNIKFHYFGVLISTAFWYLSLFLFKRNLITDYSFQISIIVSFCIGVCWETVTHLLFVAWGKDQNSIKENSVWTGQILSVFILIGYFGKFSFNTFLAMTFVTCFVIFIAFVIRKNRKYNSANKPNKDKE